IHGSNDQIVPFEATGKLAAAMIPGSALKVYDNAPHGFAVTHQDQLNQDLLAFLQR
ncbi:alpha/beta fold hydrolase, partial [Erwinia sp. MYb535]